MSEQPPQPPQPPQPQAWPPPVPPANPYGYPPPPNPYAAPPQNPYAAPPQNPYAAPPQNPYGPAPSNPYAAPTYGYPLPPPQYPYPAVPPNPYAYPPPSPYSYAPPSPTHHARNLVIGGIVLALVVAVIGVEAAHPRSSTAASSKTSTASNQANQPNPTAQPSPSASPTADGVTASSTLSPMSGIEVFSDSFSDRTSGWSTGTDPKGAVFAYTPAGYTITSKVAAHWLAYAPYDDAAQQINLNMTARESKGAPTGAGFGLFCERGPDSTSNVRYEFVVNESNRWFVERNQGAVAMSSTPTILDEGTLPATLGTQDLQISGICATLADGQTTRLALFVGAQKVADITDTTSLDSDGWLGGLISSGDDVSSTTTVAGYTESDLGNDGILAANT